MRVLTRKLRSHGGFTLVEMLIVVAIIAVLIAVSIPIVGNTLEKARCATDAANERAASGLARIQYLTGNITTIPAGSGNSTFGAYLYKVDDAGGTLVSWTSYMDCGATYGQSVSHNHKDKYIWVHVFDDGTIELTWSKIPSGTSGITWGSDLCGEHVLLGT